MGARISPDVHTGDLVEMHRPDGSTVIGRLDLRFMPDGWVLDLHRTGLADCGVRAILDGSIVHPVYLHGCDCLAVTA